MFTLYGNASPNVLKISIALNELDFPYNWKHVNIWAGQQFRSPIRDLNPLSKVPILVETNEGGEDTVLFESGAILLYLAEKAPHRIMPPDEKERLEALKWLFVQCANIGPMFGQVTHFAKYAPKSDDYALRRYRRQAERLYAVLEDRLSQNRYLSGDHYSVADIATFPWVRLHEQHVEQVGPSVLRWLATVASREAVDAAVKRHLADVWPSDMAMRDAAQSTDLDTLFPGRA